MQAFSVSFVNYTDEGEYELESSDTVLFGNYEEVEEQAWRICKAISIAWNVASTEPDREYDISPCICELSDKDVAWKIYKAENWYTGCVKEWLSDGEYQWRKIESAIWDKWHCIVDEEYCQRILPLVQKHFKERGAAYSAYIR